MLRPFGTPLVAAMLAMSCLAVPVSAQIGVATEIITGRVLGPDSLPLEGAQVEVTATASGAVRRVRTASNGRFSMLFRDGGGQYRLLVTSVGMAPARVQLTRQGDEDRLVVAVQMSRTATQLAAVQVRTRTGGNQQQPPQPAGAGSLERQLSAQLLERITSDAGDVLGSASLVPGVVAAAGSDSGRAGLTVAAQPASQNNLTLDGASFLFGSLPQDGVRGTRVATNAYDVSVGQFTGAQVSTTTRAGSSRHEASMSYTGRDRRLQSAGNPAAGFGQRFSQHVVSAGAGGPFARSDRAYYYASGQFERRSDALLSLATAPGSALSRLGTSADSVARLLALITPGTTPGADALAAMRDRSMTSASGLLRMDVDVGDVHAVTVRGDLRHSRQEASRVSPLALPSSGGATSSTGGGLMVSASSLIGAFINEGRLYASADRQSSRAYNDAPTGVVFVTSDLDIGGRGIAAYQVGGNPALPFDARRRMFEGSNELSRLSASGAHRVKLGLLVNHEDARTDQVPNRAGTFLYNSIADFEAGEAGLYTRTIAGRQRFGGSTTLGAYLGDAWRASPSFQLSFGTRLEGTRIGGSQRANAAVMEAFDVRTDGTIRDWRVSPRIGFTYLMGNVAGLPSTTIRGGFGEFRGRVPSELLAIASSADGLADAQQQIMCVGSAVPKVEWTALVSGAVSAPSTCRDGSSPGQIAQAPNVIALDRSMAAPRVWRSSLGFTRRLPRFMTFGLDVTHAYGVANPVAMDRNLRELPVYVTGAEADRPFYADPTAVDTRTGNVALGASRVDDAFGSVLTLGSALRSRTAQVTAQVVGPGLRGGFFNLSYTLQRARDESNGYALGNAMPVTDGDPRRVRWATSDLERRHNVQLVSVTPIPLRMELAVTARFTSGAPFSPMVSGDVNGDGTRNDLAFVPAPSAIDGSGEAAGMARLLQRADARTRSCLARQIGRIAQRNSCSTPWSTGLDLQLNYRPARADNRVIISLSATNVLAGLDEALHGAHDVRGWGQPALPDRTLLQARGYDASARQFRYEVNERFGARSGANLPWRVPFQLGLQARILLGTDQARAQRRLALGDTGSKPPSVSDVKARFLAQIPKPITDLFASADSIDLALSTEQRTRLTALQVEYDRKTDSLLTAAATIIVEAGRTPDPSVIAPKLQPNQQELIRTVQRVVTDAKSILSAEQWARLPERVRFPLQQPPASPPPRGDRGGEAMTAAHASTD